MAPSGTTRRLSAPTSRTPRERSSAAGRRTEEARSGAGARVHGGDQLEVVPVRILERRHQRSRHVLEAVRLPHDRAAGSLEAIEVSLDVGRLEVEDDASGLAAAPLDLAVRSDG